MSLIIRIDVDRAYGAKNILFKTLSYLSSSLPYFPKIPFFGYLNDLKVFLKYLNKNNVSAKIFFRMCSLPDKKTLKLIKKRNHEICWHAENTKDFYSFKKEFDIIKNSFKDYKIKTFSKHGSGHLHRTKLKKFGYFHDPIYDLERFLEFGSKIGLKEFYGNQEIPSLDYKKYKHLRYVKGCFWINPEYRNLEKYDINWILENSKKHDIVLLIHPSNWISNKKISQDFKKIIDNL